MIAIDARSLLAEATADLAAAGIDSARVDAELLLASCAGVDRGRLLLLDRVDGTVVAEFRVAVSRRAGREPLQHIVGHAPFRYLALDVGDGVFVPRPETELLIDAALADLRLVPHPLVVDLASGSGALALAVANEIPGARVYAVENSARALAYLHRNAEGTGVTVVDGDVRDESVLSGLDATVDVVLSNPPYVPSTVEVSPEVARDPAVAVFAGEQGLDLIPAVSVAASRLLRPGGLLVIEHDESHGEAVPALLRAGEHVWADVADHRDLTGRPRFATARRASPRRR